MSALLVTGIGVFVAGLVAAAFGIPVKEFSFGNTLIMSGAVISCTGLIMISLSLVIRELRVIARRLRSEAAADDYNHDQLSPIAPVPESTSDIAASRPGLPSVDQTASSAVANPPVGSSIPSPPPWQSEMTSRDRGASRADLGRDAAAPEPPPTSVAPPPKQRRNLLFSSSLRKDRERAAARLSDPAADSPSSTSPPAGPDPDMSPPPSFDDAWPRPERSRTEQGRAVSSPAMSRFDRASEARGQTAPAVTVLKSGVVDGMAYSLYSDGSIEAQMPEGMMRFASIDELRTHLDQRH
ncbi:MAG: hypothetical protein J0H40_07480 [Rhizobiales bacterium]|nr:hypothetical protein [Hyphomicrobiales bacterium]